MIIDSRIRELLIKIKQTFETGMSCFGIMSLCNNCQSKNNCDTKKITKKLVNEINEILEV